MNYFLKKRKGWMRNLRYDKNENPFDKDNDQEKIGEDMWNAIKKFEKEIEDENGEER